MALVQAVTTEQIQSKIDEFAIIFFDLESRAELLVAFKANLTQTNVDAGLVKGDDGMAMPPAILAEFNSRLAALQTFVTWANTGSPSPLAYLRSVKRAV